MLLRPIQFKNSEAGFTLIEILVVLVIIGAAFAITMPRFANWMEPGPESKARDIVQLAQLVRLKALQSGNRHDLIIDTDARTVRADFGSHVVRISEKLRMSASVGRDDRTTTNQGSIGFSPDGGSTGGFIRVRAMNTAKDVTVRINWLTGAVSLIGNGHAD